MSALSLSLRNFFFREKGSLHAKSATALATAPSFLRPLPNSTTTTPEKKNKYKKEEKES